MNRAEHLAWAKERALAYVDVNDPASAAASMASDLNKHPDLAGHNGILLMHLELMAGTIRTPAQMRDCIRGFN